MYLPHHVHVRESCGIAERPSVEIGLCQSPLAGSLVRRSMSSDNHSGHDRFNEARPLMGQSPLELSCEVLGTVHGDPWHAEAFADFHPV
jgi:hypothetical protein